MSEDNATQNQEPQPQPQSGQDDFSGKTHMIEEINKLRKQLEAQNKALADREAAEKAAAEERERKKLEAEGDYKAALRRLEEQNATLEASFKARERRLVLEAGFAGVQGDAADVIVAGLIAQCPAESDPADYIAQVREQRPGLWQATQSTPRISAQGMPSGGSANLANERAIIERAQTSPGSVSPKELRAAMDRVQRYRAQHGADPW